jgi:hypothetical protein
MSSFFFFCMPFLAFHPLWLLLQFLVVRQQSTLSLCCARCQPTLHRERTAVADSAGAIFHNKHL